MHTYGMIRADGQTRIVVGTHEEALAVYREHGCHGLRVMEAKIGIGIEHPTIDQWVTFLALSRRCPII